MKQFVWIIFLVISSCETGHEFENKAISGQVDLSEVEQEVNEYLKSDPYIAMKNAEILVQDGDKRQQGIGYSALGILSFYNEDYVTAAEFYLNSLKIRKDLDNSEYSLINTYLNLGMVYHVIEDFEMAFEYYNLALVTSNKSNGLRREKCYQYLGKLYNDSGEPAAALEYLYPLLSQYVEKNNKAGIASAHIFIGNSFIELEQFGKALEHQQIALEISNEIDDQDRYVMALNNISICNENLGNISEAIDKNMHAYKIAKDPKLKASITLSLGKLLLKENPTQSKQFLDEGLALAKSEHLLKEEAYAYELLKQQAPSMIIYKEYDNLALHANLDLEKIQNAAKLDYANARSDIGIMAANFEISQIKAANLKWLLITNCVIVFIALLTLFNFRKSKLIAKQV